MDAVALELRARCAGCGQVVPINAVTDGAACSACHRAIALDWQALLARALATPADTGAFAVHAGDTTITVARRPAPASCPSCTAALPDEVKQFASRGWTMCPSCGNKLAIRTPPAQLGWAHAELVVAEELAPPVATVPPPPVMVACLACRAPIRADGAARIVRCLGCTVDNYLPDDLWLHLHPPPATLRWFVVGGAPPHAHHGHHAPPVQPVAPPAPVAAPVQLAGPAAAAALGAIFGANVQVQPGANIVVQRVSRADRTGTPAQFASMIVHGREARHCWGEHDDGPDKWSSLENVVMGPDGLFYCGGENDWGDAVWCMGPDLVPRWVHQLKLNDVHVALEPKHQRVVCWSTSKHSAILLSAADGAMVGSIGGKEPDDAKVHHLDMDECKELVGDLDGTLLALMGERLLRYDAHGTGIATWPPHSGLFGAKAEKLESLFVMRADGKRGSRDIEGVNVEDIGNYPLAIDDYSNLHVGRDGRYYLERARWVACFDRTGKRLYKRQLPLESLDDQLATDALGNLYLYGNRGSDPKSRQVVRVSPDGARVDVVAKDRTAGGSVGDEDKLCVGPDGTIYLFDYGRRARIIGVDGGLRWQSPRSIEHDQDEDKRAAEQA